MRVPSFKAIRIVVCLALLAASAALGAMLWLDYPEHQARVAAIMETAAAGDDGDGDDVAVVTQTVSASREGQRVALLQSRHDGTRSEEALAADARELSDMGLDGFWREWCDAVSWEFESSYSMEGTVCPAVWIGLDASGGICAYATAIWSFDDGTFSNARVFAVTADAADADGSDESADPEPAADAEEALPADAADAAEGEDGGGEGGDVDAS